MRKGFTLIELIFVIVITGILSKFGVELLYKTYDTYITSHMFNKLSNESEMAVKQLSNRLANRIKDSTIARVGTTGAVVPIGSITGTETVLEWIGVDTDGWSTSGAPEWSGLIDLSPVTTSGLATSTTTSLSSPGTNVNTTGALFFIGAPIDLNNNFGYDGSAVTTQSESIHPVTIAGSAITSANGSDFTNVDVYEFYQFAKTAYAVSFENNQLVLYYDYQPWDGESMTSGSHAVLVDDVKSFDFATIGDILIVQVCLTDNNAAGLGEYSLCKEKTIF